MMNKKYCPRCLRDSVSAKNCNHVHCPMKEKKMVHPYLRRIQLRRCDCGSGLEKHAERDARGIFLCYVCEKCKAEKLSHYRPEVLTDPNYWHDEPIDDDGEE